MEKELTKRQKLIFDALCEYVNNNGYAPSYRELAKICNLASPSTVKNHLDKLRIKGYITWIEGQPRTIQILKH